MRNINKLNEGEASRLHESSYRGCQGAEVLPHRLRYKSVGERPILVRIKFADLGIEPILELDCQIADLLQLGALCLVLETVLLHLRPEYIDEFDDCLDSPAIRSQELASLPTDLGWLPKSSGLVLDRLGLVDSIFSADR